MLKWSILLWLHKTLQQNDSTPQCLFSPTQFISWLSLCLFLFFSLSLAYLSLSLYLLLSSPLRHCPEISLQAWLQLKTNSGDVPVCLSSVSLCLCVENSAAHILSGRLRAMTAGVHFALQLRVIPTQSDMFSSLKCWDGQVIHTYYVDYVVCKERDKHLSKTNTSTECQSHLVSVGIEVSLRL